MKHLILAIALVIAPAAANALASEAAENAAPSVAQLPRHLVMFTRAGPNFSKIADHRADIRTHQQLWRMLNVEGHTVAGGAFEGTPVMGMTIFSAGIDEARARELIKDDPFPKLGFTQYEFRTLMVVDGSLKGS